MPYALDESEVTCTEGAKGELLESADLPKASSGSVTCDRKPLPLGGAVLGEGVRDRQRAD